MLLLRALPQRPQHQSLLRAQPHQLLLLHPAHTAPPLLLLPAPWPPPHPPARAILSPQPNHPPRVTLSPETLQEPQPPHLKAIPSPPPDHPQKVTPNHHLPAQPLLLPRAIPSPPHALLPRVIPSQHRPPAQQHPPPRATHNLQEPQPHPPRATHSPQQSHALLPRQLPPQRVTPSLPPLHPVLVVEGPKAPPSPHKVCK